MVGKNSLVVQFYIGFKAISGYLGIKKIDDLMKKYQRILLQPGKR